MSKIERSRDQNQQRIKIVRCDFQCWDKIENIIVKAKSVILE